MDDHFHTALAQVAHDVELTLARLLPESDSSLIAAPMRHAVLNGGKRLRAFLVITTARLYGVQPSQALRAAAAIECLHAYSLVHDDLPAMDNDALRRGKPTVHVKWDEATAVLTGDALHSLAFEILTDPATAPEPAVRLRLIREMAIAAGGQGMVQGQVLDIHAETSVEKQTVDQIIDLQNKKTGALFVWAAQAGPNLANSNVTVMGIYAETLGLAFQIQDDILDVEGNAGQVGKHLQKDSSAGKATFVSALGLQGAKDRAAMLVQEANDVLSPFGTGADNLRHLAQFAIQRDK